MKNLPIYTVENHQESELLPGVIYAVHVGGSGNSAGGRSSLKLIKDFQFIGDAASGYSIADNAYFGSAGGSVTQWYRIGDGEVTEGDIRELYPPAWMSSGLKFEQALEIAIDARISAHVDEMERKMDESISQYFDQTA